MPLNEPKVRCAKPRHAPYKLFDSGGLFLVVTPGGSKLWRFRFKYCGREKLLALGKYPSMGLLAARRARDQALEELQAGLNPAEEKRARTGKGRTRIPTFENVALEWHELRKHEWTPAYARQVLSRLEEDIFPKLGKAPICEITPRDMLAALKRVEARGVFETTRRLKQYCGAIFRYAIASGHCDQDPTFALKGALKSPPRPKHHKALKREEIGEFLIRLSNYEGEPQTRIAIELALLMVPRTNELRGAMWREFADWREGQSEGLWRVPAERMKMGDPHLVPLSRQACDRLRALHALTGECPHLFPSSSEEGVMSNNTMIFALYRMGYRGRTTTHGFRRMFSTEANEHGWKEDWIERQLAHDERNRIRAAYNAAQYLPQRRELMQWWADHLDALREAQLGKLASARYSTESGSPEQMDLFS